MPLEEILKSLDIGIRVLKDEVENADIDTLKEEAETELFIAHLAKELLSILEKRNKEKIEATATL
ncbi:MAG: hypothetical protein QXU09_03835 [Thermoproteota archaeon]